MNLSKDKRTVSLIVFQIVLVVIRKCSADQKYWIPSVYPPNPNGTSFPLLPQRPPISVHYPRQDGKKKNFYSAKFSNSSENFSITSDVPKYESVTVKYSPSPIINWNSSPNDHFTNINAKQGSQWASDKQSSGSVVISEIAPIPGPDFKSEFVGQYPFANEHYSSFYSPQVHYADDKPFTYHSYEDLPEADDNRFSKTVLATKILKLGKFIFVFFMVLVVLLMAGISKTGVALSPVVLPLALIPIGIVALFLFIPLLVLIMPLVARANETGAYRSERRKRRRKKRHLELETNLGLIGKIDEYLLRMDLSLPTRSKIVWLRK